MGNGAEKEAPVGPRLMAGDGEMGGGGGNTTVHGPPGAAGLAQAEPQNGHCILPPQVTHGMG